MTSRGRSVSFSAYAQIALRRGIEPGPAPVVGDPLAEHRVAELVAQRCSVGDQAVEAPVGGADDDRDHLAVGGAQILGRLVQLAEVRKPRAQTLRPERIDAKHVRHEPEPLARLGEQALQAGRQVGLVGDRKPRSGLAWLSHRVANFTVTRSVLGARATGIDSPLVTSGARAISLSRLRRPWTPGQGSPRLLPVWSVPAALRAVRTTLVMPTLFVITYKVIGNVQMATFAAFGSFATLVLAGFGGGWRDKLIAHTGLALAGGLLLTIGTLVSHSTLLAALVSVPVAFSVFFAGIIGPNAASGAIAALLPYVLPAASPGTAAMIPDRLAGWWLASVVGTAAVLALSAPSPGDKLKRAAAKLASELVSELEAMLRGDARDEQLTAAIEAKHELVTQFTSTPYRPTGLGTADQAMANAVELLEWCTSLIVDSAHERSDLSGAPADERELLEGRGGSSCATPARWAAATPGPTSSAWRSAGSRASRV